MKLPTDRVQRGLARSVLVVYTALLLKVVLFKNPAALLAWQGFSMAGVRFRLSYAINLIPFKTVLFYLSGSQPLRLALLNLGGNLALLGPLGLLLPYAFPKVRTCRQIAAISLAVSLLLELVQLLTGLGSFDVDDLILNVAGAVLGWLVYRGATMLLGRTGRIKPTPARGDS